MDISSVYHHLSKIQQSSAEDDARIAALRTERTKLEDALTVSRTTNENLRVRVEQATTQVSSQRAELALLNDRIRILREVLKRESRMGQQWIQRQEEQQSKEVSMSWGQLQATWRTAVCNAQVAFEAQKERAFASRSAMKCSNDNASTAISTALTLAEDSDFLEDLSVPTVPDTNEQQNVEPVSIHDNGSFLRGRSDGVATVVSQKAKPVTKKTLFRFLSKDC